MAEGNKKQISDKSLGRAIFALVILILLFLAFSPFTRSFMGLGKGLFYLFGMIGPYYILPILLSFSVLSFALGHFPAKRGGRTLIGLLLAFFAFSSLSSHLGLSGKESFDYLFFHDIYASLSPVQCFYSKSIGGGVIGYYLSASFSVGGASWLYLIDAVLVVSALVVVFFPEIKALLLKGKGQRVLRASKRKEEENARNQESLRKAREDREAANQPLHAPSSTPFVATPVISSPLQESSFVSSVPVPPPFVSAAPKKVISDYETPATSRLDLYGEKPKNPVPVDLTDEATRRHTPSTPASYFYDGSLQEAKFVPSAGAPKAASPAINKPIVKEEPSRPAPAQKPSGSTTGLFMNETPSPIPSLKEEVPLFMEPLAPKKEEVAPKEETTKTVVASSPEVAAPIPSQPQNSVLSSSKPLEAPASETVSPEAPFSKEEAKPEEPCLSEPQPALSISPLEEKTEEAPFTAAPISPIIQEEKPLSEEIAPTSPVLEAKEEKLNETPVIPSVTPQEEETPSIANGPSLPPVQEETAVEEEPVPEEEPEATDPDAQPEAKPLPQYNLPGLDLLKDYPSANEHKAEQIAECDARKDLINQIFDGFNAGAHVVDYTVGPSVTRYNILTDANVTVTSINRYIQDISVRLGGVPTRYEEIVMGQSYSGLEIANRITTMVSLKDTVRKLPPLSPKTNLYIPFGESISGDYISSDLSEFPHMLISGSTGSGKSVFMHGLIMSLIMRNRPEDLKLVMVDPKRVEMACYKEIPHLLCPIIKEPSQAKVCFQKLIAEMERRYKLFEQTGVRNIREFNTEYASEHNLSKLPFIVVIVDEFADLVDTCKDIGEYVVRIAQKARAAGMHLVIATQRPTVDVVTGTIKANLACRVALSVASFQDSSTILGQGGAEDLAGHGDMLVDCSQVLRNGLIRAQGCYVDTHEIASVTSFIRAQMGTQYDPRFLDLVDHEEEAEKAEAAAPSRAELRAAQGDDFYEMVKETIMGREYTSISRIQREFGVGFPRAGKIFNRLQEDGVVAHEPDTASSSKGCRVIKHTSDASGGSSSSSPAGGDGN